MPLSLVTGIIGAVFFAIDVANMINSLRPEPFKTTIEIGVGISPARRNPDGTTTPDPNQVGGNLPNIRLWTDDYQHVGTTFTNGAKARSGETRTLTVDHSDAVGNIMPAYLALPQGGNDAICIAYVIMTPPVGGSYTWLADIGKQCGARWYPSNRAVGDVVGGETNYRPPCIWIDGDNSYGNFPHQGIGMHIVDFASTEGRNRQYQEHPDSLCGSRPRFGLYEQMNHETVLPMFEPVLEYNEDFTDKDLSKVIGVEGFVPRKAKRSDEPDHGPRNLARSERDARKVRAREESQPQKQFMEGELVISHDPYQSAKELCESETSLGPDFVSMKENLFCDMGKKEIWTLCARNSTGGCFDMETKTMLKMGLETRDMATGREIPEKSYFNVDEWM